MPHGIELWCRPRDLNCPAPIVVDMALPDETDRVIEQLRADLKHIHFRWIAVKELWHTTAEQMRFIDKYGQDFFALVQRAQVDDLTLALARFTDVDKGGENRSVNLNDAIETVLGRGAWKAAVKRLESVWPKMKDMRDRVLAHRDYDLHVAERPEKPVQGISYGEMRRFVEEVTALMKEVDEAFDGAAIAYDDPIRFGSWDGIFHGLKCAERLESLGHRAASSLPIRGEDYILPIPSRRKL